MRASSGVIFISSLVVPVRAYDVTDRFSISAAAAVTGQCQNLSGNSDASDSCRGALVFQPNLSFLPTPDNEFFVKLGLAAGNGLNDTSPFNPAPWATDLKDGVKDINGRGRNYLLTAWYRHGLILAPDNSLNITLGIIDATEFLDINAYANDEHTQFMNEVFVNSPQAFMPSYDWGGALQWDV